MNANAPSYRKNESDREADDFEKANDDSSIRIFTDETHRHEGAPQRGAGVNLVKTRTGVLGSYGDKPHVIDAKAGKARASDSNPVQ